MSLDAKFRSVEVVDRQGPGEGLHRPSGSDVIMRLKINGRIRKARIDIGEFKNGTTRSAIFLRTKRSRK